MPASEAPYRAAFRHQMIELVESGRTPAQLAREFGVTARTISNWVTQAAIDKGKPLPGKDGLSSAEREELNLAVVLDAWSRRVVGWSIGEHMTAELVLAALNMALAQRRPDGVIHHSDHGCQYTSVAFGKRCREMGVRPSMGSVGDAYDNAMAESFFASLECELLDRRSFKSKTEGRLAVFTWLEGWYNPRRRHSRLGYLSPANFERKHREAIPISNEHGLPTAPLASGLGGAGGGAVDKPAPELFNA